MGEWDDGPAGGGAAGGRPKLPRGQLRVLAAIIRLITPDYPLTDTAHRAGVQDDVTRYVASQIQGMPGFLRVPYRLALFGFAWLPLLRYARPFGRLPADVQLAYLAFWSDAPLAPMRDFVKLIRSSALLVYFDHPLVMERLEAERRQPHAEQRVAL
jgi:hypothetical protein